MKQIDQNRIILTPEKKTPYYAFIQSINKRKRKQASAFCFKQHPFSVWIYNCM